MKVNKIILKSIRKFNSIETFNLEDAKRMNTLSGRNGSGKTTIFESLMLVQKAYFAKKMMNTFISEYKEQSLEEIIGDEFFGFIKNSESSISVELKFESEDFTNLHLLKQTRFNQLIVDNNLDNPEDIDVKLTLSINQLLEESVDWSITCENDFQAAILDLFWDLEQPKSIIAYISADKTVEEKDVNFQELKLNSVDKISPIINFILKPNEIYYNLYSIMINDYIYERIIPQKPKKNKYFDEAKILLNKLIPYIKISNFSGKYRNNQFILLANSDGNGKNFDIRKFSSGEKLVWYSLLLLSYIEDMGILIIDEPENHLHEELACRFIKILEDIGQGNLEDSEIRLGQTYLITHSKTIIYNNFGSGENYVLGKEEFHKVEFESCEKTLRSLGLSYTNDKILFVEGDTEVTLLQNLLANNNIKVKELGNCADIIRTFNGLIKVKNYLSDPQFIFLIDRDTRDENSIQDLRNKDQNYFDQHFIILEKHEIENYFIDLEAIKKTVDYFTASFGTDEISIDEIRTVVKSIADNKLDFTKKKYMNTILRNKLSTIESFIKQRDLNVDSIDSHRVYINSLFNGENWDNVKNQLIDVFSSMEDTYTEEKWNNNWLDLLDGKIVFSLSITELSRKVGVDKNIFEKKLTEYIISNDNSDFMRLIRKIIGLFEDN